MKGLILCASLLSSSLVCADVLVMDNGDTLTGKLIKKTRKNVVFKPARTDAVKVLFDHVQELKTDQPVIILRSDGQVDTLPLSYVAGEDAGSDLGLVADDLVNPTDALLGKGVGYSGRLNVSARSESGNSEIRDVDLDGQFKIRYKKQRLTLKGEWQEDEIDGLESGEKWLSQLEYAYYVDDKVYVTASSTAEADESASLDLRSTVAAGVGYDMVKSEANTVSVQLNGVRVREEFDLDDEPSDQYWAAGYSGAYDHRFMGGRITYYLNHDGIIDVENSGKAILKLWTGVLAPISERMVASGEVKVETDSDPADDEVEQTHVTYRLKIGYFW